MLFYAAGMSWLQDGVNRSIWGFIMDFISDIMSKAFTLITDLILGASNLNQYFTISTYVNPVQAISAALLVLAVVWEVTKQQAGKVMPGDEKSLGTLAGQTLVAGFLIFFLPWSVQNVFIRINNLLIELIKSIGISVDPNTFQAKMQLGVDPNVIGGLTIIMTLILVIGFLGIGIAAGIRFIELMFITLISPIVAISAVRNYDALQIWVRETVAVVFTQCIQLIALQFIMVIMINISGVMLFILSIGCIVIGLRGPQMLRQFLYSSGTGSAMVGAAGSVGRMAAMKIMFRAIK